MWYKVPRWGLSHSRCHEDSSVIVTEPSVGEAYGGGSPGPEPFCRTQRKLTLDLSRHLNSPVIY